ncbi:MAG: L-threonine 3-dehydrogenase [Pseudomonadota bacterium]|nr:L-threonine 3-dehydrogenase [Pseudomonadota bacterium]
MQALVKAKAQPGLWLEEVNIPKISDNEVLVKIKKTAICGTDLHIYKWDEWSQKTIPVPMVVGHEFVGEVAAIGKNVTNCKIGDRVSGEGHVVCNECRNCRAGKKHLCPYTKGIGVNIPGAFAEYLAIPASNIFHVPKFVNDNIASMFDPYGNAVHTALAFNCTGEDVLVTGAGPIGIMCALIVKHIGARHVVITDINEHRLALANNYPSIIKVNVANESLADVQAKLNMKEGFDIGLEVAGSQNSLNDIVDNILNGGKIALLGLYNSDIKVDMNKIIFKGLDLRGIYGREMYETWYKAVALLETGLNLDHIITDTFNYNDYDSAFEKMLSGNSGKIVLDWY